MPTYRTTTVEHNADVYVLREAIGFDEMQRDAISGPFIRALRERNYPMTAETELISALYFMSIMLQLDRPASTLSYAWPTATDAPNQWVDAYEWLYFDPAQTALARRLYLAVDSLVFTPSDPDLAPTVDPKP